MKKAFTLIELLVVMAIIAIALALGIYGMTAFKRAVLLQQATDEVLTAMKETRTLAENNVIPDNLSTENFIYGYKLRFVNSSGTSIIERVICSLNTSVPGSNWNCPASGQNLRSDLFAEINHNFSSGSACREVFFENLTGDILIKRQLTDVNFTEGICEIEVRHRSQNSGTNVILYIDSSRNTFQLLTD